jgi:hypothetical protein
MPELEKGDISDDNSTEQDFEEVDNLDEQDGEQDYEEEDEGEETHLFSTRNIILFTVSGLVVVIASVLLSHFVIFNQNTPKNDIKLPGTSPHDLPKMAGEKMRPNIPMNQPIVETKSTTPLNKKHTIFAVSVCVFILVLVSIATGLYIYYARPNIQALVDEEQGKRAEEEKARKLLQEEKLRRKKESEAEQAAKAAQEAKAVHWRVVYISTIVGFCLTPALIILLLKFGSTNVKQRLIIFVFLIPFIYSFLLAGLFQSPGAFFAVFGSVVAGGVPVLAFFYLKGREEIKDAPKQFAERWAKGNLATRNISIVITVLSLIGIVVGLLCHFFLLT